ncbi:S9 family peptidase [Ideonella livida]|uniref:S9 family peptidase n=1 Tax=Ideonella livida TaxID=2707176 RepID=A0A7C9TIY3_9BURK|nr:prolyl oligopeptidase family serine peptidase [Ideonella livida]NDY91641.1 S9 family peptidase [Ideonella livida]
MTQPMTQPVPQRPPSSSTGTREQAPRRRWLGWGLGSLGGSLLGGCAWPGRAGHLPPAAPLDLPSPRGPWLQPPPALVIDGLPPVPLSLAERVRDYTEFRGHGFLDWHPREGLLLTHRGAGQNLVQLHHLAAPGGALQRLTHGAEPVWSGSYEPAQGHGLVFERASGGDEATRLYHLDLASGQERLLTPLPERFDQGPWVHVAGQVPWLLARSVPLDRTAGSASGRAQVNTRLWRVDPRAGQAPQLLAELPGGGWQVSQVSADGRQGALLHYLSANQSEVWRLDLASGQRERLLPRSDMAGPAAFVPVGFSPAGDTLYLLSDHEGEFRRLWRLHLADGRLQALGGAVAWDVSDADLSADGRWLAATFNEAGRRRLRLFDAQSGQALPLGATLEGSISALRFHPQRPWLAVNLVAPATPLQVQVLDLSDGPARARWQRWTEPVAPAGLDPRRFSRQEVVDWPSFDGRRISGLLNRPDPARHPGRRPVLVLIHGGPEGQATEGFLGRYHYLIEELGIALLQPNVRGSSGFGKTFLKLDNGRLREDAVRDISALLDWLPGQAGLDAAQVVVSGGSYGGYMSLAVAIHEGARIAGAIDSVGISHFVTFLERTESYRRDLRRVEYGDERDPAMREFLDRISPLTQAHRLRRPLMVIQGRNDPRVPWTEAEQIVQRARAQGVPVGYLLAENEGHGFARKENADYEFLAKVLFIQQALAQSQR